MWYRILYELALIACLMRGWRMRHTIPFFLWSLLISAVLNFRYLPESSAWLASIWPALLILAPLSRSVATLEAYARVLTEGFWEHARSLEKALQWLSTAEVLILAAIAEPTRALLITDLGAWLKVWNAHWFGLAVVFMWFWPGLRRGLILHALILEGILSVEAAGALAHFSRVTWTPWHATDAVLYLISTVLLVVWCWRIPAKTASWHSNRPARAALGKYLQ